jgi:hypothetical protein
VKLAKNWAKSSGSWSKQARNRAKSRGSWAKLDRNWVKLSGSWKLDRSWVKLAENSIQQVKTQQRTLQLNHKSPKSARKVTEDKS